MHENLNPMNKIISVLSALLLSSAALLHAQDPDSLYNRIQEMNEIHDDSADTTMMLVRAIDTIDTQD